MKHTILMEIILEDDHAIIYIDGKRPEEILGAGYCEYCSEVADVLQTIFEQKTTKKRETINSLSRLQ